jgi:phosphate regulon transcriptional regulator PhoB
MTSKDTEQLAGAKILVVDDDESVCELVELYLSHEGFRVIVAADGREALRLCLQHRPDLVVLDLMLPVVDGWEVCRSIRRTSRVPIIMLTARSEEVDRVVGLEVGADDYIAKPFSPREMVARVKAVLRRSLTPSDEGEMLVFSGLRIDRSCHRVEADGETTDLTPTEFQLLWCLMSDPGRVFSRTELLTRVLGPDSESDMRTIDVHIKRVRRKLDVERRSFTITTVRGLGYRLESHAPAVGSLPGGSAAPLTLLRTQSRPIRDKS